MRPPVMGMICAKWKFDHDDFAVVALDQAIEMLEGVADVAENDVTI